MYAKGTARRENEREMRGPSSMHKRAQHALFLTMKWPCAFRAMSSWVLSSKRRLDADFARASARSALETGNNGEGKHCRGKKTESVLEKRGQTCRRGLAPATTEQARVAEAKACIAHVC